MLRLNFEGLWEIIKRIEDQSWFLTMAISDISQPDDRLKLEHAIAQLRDLCVEFGLLASAKVLSNRIEDLPRTDRELAQMLEVVKGELSSLLILFIPRDRAQYFDEDPVWSAEFPSAGFDMRQAGYCFAAGADTASVYHCMRALEFGLYALAKDAEVISSRPLDTQSWGVIIDQITAAIERKRKAPGGNSADPKIVFWSDAASDFFIFKEAWRNRTNHVRAIYTQDQAKKIIEAVDHFISRLAEGGLKE